MKKFKTSIFLLIAIIIFFTKCTKEGPMGPQGPAGLNGTDGNANVESRSFSYTWQNSDFPFSSKDIINNVPTITQSIIDSGVVVGYVSTNNGATWFTLPHIISLGTNIQQVFKGEVKVGQYTVMIGRNDNINTGSINQLGGSQTIRFKIVTMSK